MTATQDQRSGICTDDEAARHLIINEQGHCPHHTENPHHDVLTQFGWEYSHTTAMPRVDGTRTAHHTYRYPGTDYVVGVVCAPGWKAYASKLGTGYHFSYFGSQLKSYLKRKTRRIQKTMA